MSPSLHEIEQTLSTLWMNKDLREEFLASAPLNNGNLESQIDARGVRLYASLLKHGHRELMLSIFPYCAQLIGKKWEATVERYLSHYPPQHYNLNRTASQFSQYLAQHEDMQMKRYPYLAELADYEWVELELLEMDKEIIVSHQATLNTPEDFAKFAPIVNPVLVIRSYEYAITRVVDQMEAHERPPKKGLRHKTDIAIYRNPQTNKCKFLETGVTAAKIIDRASTQSSSYADLLSFAISLNCLRDPEKIACEFLGLLEKLHELFVFVGSKQIHPKKEA